MRHIALLLVIVAMAMANRCTNGPTRQLQEWLANPVEDRTPLAQLDFATAPLTKKQAEAVQQILYLDHQRRLKEIYEQQWNNRVLVLDGKKMPFHYQTFGSEPSGEKSLFISLHGGGGTTPAVNNQQHENQKHLYDDIMQKIGGVYLAPRAPTNNWNLWHENHIDDFLSVIIQMAVAMENINPNKVYLLGYSAGGDGVFQLTPRMADRWAAASMMAGHPNETSPLGLKNIPFAIHMGALDGSYNRNKKAAEWKTLLDDLERDAPGTYIHQVTLHEGKGHWMELQDSVALPWMKGHQRNPYPTSVAWLQDDRHHTGFYWLAVPLDLIKTGGKVVAEYDPQQNELNILSNYSEVLHLYMNDEMLNLDDTVTIKYQGNSIAKGLFKRSVLNIYESLSAKGDVNLSFPTMVSVTNNQTVEAQ